MAKTTEPHQGVTINMEDARKSIPQGIQQMAANIVKARREAEAERDKPKNR